MGLLKRLNSFCWRSTGWCGYRHVWVDCPKLYSTIQVENWPIKWYTIWKRLLLVRVHKRDYGFYIVLGFGLFHKIITLDVFPGGVNGTDTAALKKKVKDKIKFWRTALRVDNSL